MLARGSYRNKKNGNLIYSEFKRNVLAKSINDINSNDRCDLEVTSLEEKRLGRKVQDVFFHVRYKQGRHFKADSAMKDPEVGELSVVTDQLVEKWVRALVARFKRIGRSNWHQLVLQLKNEYDNDRIEKNIDYLLCQQQRIKILKAI
ncbi:hypothetical protein [Persicobacter diffluens]|uniref:Uncharacterized protein n=1 Tax=Persicobacter diffluens TaxID=981 RepID=A0AAN4W4T3_9BACT|nr:hypothetical protein PEDI_57040 [Persicobacter diffluens]